MYIFPQLNKRNPNVIYETGLEHLGIILLIKNKEKLIFSDSLSIESLKSSTKIKVLNIREFEHFIKDENINLDLQHCSASLYIKLKKLAKNIKDSSNIWLEKRMKKNNKEIEKLKNSSNIAKKALEFANDVLKKEHKMAEIALRFKTIEFFSKNKSYESFPTIVACKKHSKFPHHLASKTKIKGHVLFDRGCIYNNYSSDLTDVINIKEKNIKKEYETLINIFYSIVDELPKMEKANELHKYYLSLYKKHGLKEMPHLIGHGIGVEVHEWPIISKDSKHELENTVITIEPSIYKSNYGLRFERMVYIGKRKAYVL
jgi:Xaa-Pro aminopeptidase